MVGQKAVQGQQAKCAVQLLHRGHSCTKQQHRPQNLKVSSDLLKSNLALIQSTLSMQNYQEMSAQLTTRVSTAGKLTLSIAAAIKLMVAYACVQTTSIYVFNPNISSNFDKECTCKLSLHITCTFAHQMGN
jgi:hypothetical protein